MQYTAVYEITREPFPWWIPAWLAVLALIGTVILLGTRGLGPITTIVRIGVALFACIAVVLAGLNLHARTQVLDAYQNGRYAVVTGRVAHHAFSGKTECFEVAPIKFCRGTVQSVFAEAIVQDGESVRVAYFGELKPDSYPVILRIETGQAAK